MKQFIWKILCIAIVLCGACDNKKNIPDADTDMLALLNAKMKNDPKNPDLYYQQAKVYYEQDRINDARSSCLYAIELNGKKPDFYLLLTDIYLKSGDYESAVQSIQRIFEIDPENIEAHLKQAELSLLVKDYQRVKDEAKAVLDIDNLNAQAYFLRGYASKEQGDTFSAVRDYKRTVELDPENGLAYEELGLLYALRKDKAAIDYLNSAINMNPKNTIPMYALAMYYQNIEQYDKALEIYEMILSISPEHTNALHNMGYIELVVNENYPKAIADFTKAIETDSTFVSAFYNRGYAYELSGNKKQAIEDYTTVLTIDPEFKKAQEHLKKIK